MTELTQPESLTEKLQRAEARALAAEKAIAYFFKLYNDKSITLDYVANLSASELGEIDLTAARELMRKAEDHDARLAQLLEQTRIHRLNTDQWKDELQALRAERDELAALVEKVRSLDYDCSSHVDKRAWIPNEVWDSDAASTALADLKAKVRREVLEEAAKHYDQIKAGWTAEFELTFTCDEIAAELRRMAEEGK